jgi:Na+-driven multidrug efflux pump
LELSEKTLIKDLTQGNPMKQLLSFAFPFVLANLLQQAYNLADMVIVGQFVGSAGLAAASAGGELAMLFLFFALGSAPPARSSSPSTSARETGTGWARPSAR